MTNRFAIGKKGEGNPIARRSLVASFRPQNFQHPISVLRFSFLPFFFLFEIRVLRGFLQVPVSVLVA